MTEDNPGTERVERDLDHTRARLDATIDALQDKLSPGQIFDQAVAYLKEGSGAEFSRNLVHSMRDNPLPVTLVGIGLAWLMIAGPRREEAERRDYGYDEARRRDYTTPDYGAAGRRYTEHYPQPVLPDTTASTYAGTGTYAETGGTYQAESGGDYEDLATRAREAGERLQREENETTEAFEERVYAAKGSTLGLTRNAGETMSAFRERVDGALSTAAERFRRMREQAAAAVSGMAERGRSAASGAYDYGRSAASGAYGYGQSAASGAYGYGQSAAAGARDSADYAARQAREMSMRTASYLQDQPLVLGAIGVTVGAALGLLVPPTRYERELFGGVREAMRDQARAAAGEVGERVSRVAEAVVGTAQEAAQREGLVGTDVQQKTAELGQQADQKAAELHGQVSDAAGRVRSVVEETVSAGRAAVERELSGGEGQQGGKPGSEPNRTS